MTRDLAASFSKQLLAGRAHGRRALLQRQPDDEGDRPRDADLREPRLPDPHEAAQEAQGPPDEHRERDAPRRSRAAGPQDAIAARRARDRVDRPRAARPPAGDARRRLGGSASSQGSADARGARTRPRRQRPSRDWRRGSRGSGGGSSRRARSGPRARSARAPPRTRRRRRRARRASASTVATSARSQAASSGGPLGRGQLVGRAVGARRLDEGQRAPVGDEEAREEPVGRDEAVAGAAPQPRAADPRERRAREARARGASRASRGGDATGPSIPSQSRTIATSPNGTPVCAMPNGPGFMPRSTISRGARP